jgi:hypothetical protein
MKEIILSSSSKDDFIAKLEGFSKQQFSAEVKMTIIIDGQTLVYALSDDVISQKFFLFGMKANSVICC